MKPIIFITVAKLTAAANFGANYKEWRITLASLLETLYVRLDKNMDAGPFSIFIVVFRNFAKFYEETTVLLRAVDY